ncbi:MAG: ABC transporter permease [Dehalococcoidales bacterium]|nr:ABC transporter permease [Dehalococcoidales bacterium]
MKFIDSLKLAISSLTVNKLRSSLTMLGIIIGVGAVITLMSVGRGVQAQITETIEDYGSNTLNVISQTPGVKGLAAMQAATPSLTLEDSQAIAERIPYVTRVAPVSENYVDVTFADSSTLGVIEASTPDFEDVYNYHTASGRFINDRDIGLKDSVVVLGEKVVKDLFGTKDPIGQKVKLSGRSFTVVGVLEPKGGQMMGVSMDSIIVVPITTYQSKLFPRQTSSGEDAVQSIAVQITSSEHSDFVTAEVEDLLRRRHRIGAGDKDDFAIISNEQILSLFQQITGALTIFLGAVAGISLLVGSIGIMNIMLVSVTERTREIGIRKAVGAKRRDILLQFLIEAAMMSFTGGGIGIIGGWLLSLLISQIDLSGTTLRAVVSPDIIILAVSVSIFIGIASGMYPAMRASRLNPIDALHYG